MARQRKGELPMTPQEIVDIYRNFNLSQQISVFNDIKVILFEKKKEAEEAVKELLTALKD